MGMLPGRSRTGGTNLLTREDLSQITESWSIAWSPEFDSSIIEAARYGVTLDDASSAVLVERGRAIDHGVGAAAELLMECKVIANR